MDRYFKIFVVYFHAAVKAKILTIPKLSMFPKTSNYHTNI